MENNNHLIRKLHRHCLRMATWRHHSEGLLRHPDLRKSGGKLRPLEHRLGSDIDVEIGIERSGCSCCWRWWRRWRCRHRFWQNWWRLFERLQGENLFISLLLVVVLFAWVGVKVGLDLEAGDELDGLHDEFWGRNQSFFTSQVKRKLIVEFPQLPQYGFIIVQKTFIKIVTI